MPSKRPPKTLYQRSIEVSTCAILMEWQGRCEQDKSGTSVLFTNILPMFPPAVLNSLVTGVVELFVETEDINSDGGLKPSVDVSMANLLGCVMSDRLTSLDLSPLARLDSISPTDIAKTEKIILKYLPKMSNLVTLSLKANRNALTVPICGDELLKAIGSSCPKLKSLDVSYNHTVTNTGLTYLWTKPHDSKTGSSYRGCRELKKLTVFGCAVTAEGVSKLLEHIETLQIVAFKEIGAAVMLLNKRKSDVKLNLVYLNNMGCGMKTIGDLNKLHYSCKMSHVVVKMCPNITELKIRVTDATLEHVVLGPSINSMHLLYDCGRQLSVGRGTLNLVKNYGQQLTTLSLICSTISTDQMIKISNCCENLETLTIKCGQIYDSEGILSSDFRKYKSTKSFSSLQNLFFTVLTNNEHLGILFLPYIVYSTALKNLYFSFNSTLITNEWVEDLLSYFDTKNLVTFIIDLPHHVLTQSALSLTKKSLDHIIAKCPNINTVGNLFAWCIDVEEIKELCRLKASENSDLDFVYHPVPVHMNFETYT